MKKIFTLLALAFCSTAFGQIINGGMETWRTFTIGGTALTNPNGWNSTDSIIYTAGPTICPTCTLTPLTFQSDTAHSGSYGAEIMTKHYGGALGYASGLLTNCQVNFNTMTDQEWLSGGSVTHSRTDSVTAWIKYVPYGGDSGSVSVQAVLAGRAVGGYDSVVGTGQDITIVSGRNYILATPVYTRHTYVITYTTGTVVPDHIQISFRTDNTTSEHDSSTMYIDDVAMNMPGALGVQLMHSSGVTCYPNPAGNALHIQTADYPGTTAEVYNMQGQPVATQSLTAYSTDINIGNLSPGLYYLRLVGANNDVVYSGKVVKQ